MSVVAVQLRNTGRSAIAGRLFLALDHLRPGVRLTNASGVTGCAPPLDQPYVSVALSSGVLRPGATISVLLEFDSPSRQAIAYMPRALAGGMLP